MDVKKKIFDFGKSSRLLWVEVGSNSLACIVTERKAEEIRIVAKLVKELGVDKSDDTASRQNAITIALRKFLSQHGLKGTKAICLMPDDLVRIFSFIFPTMAASDLKKAVRLSVAGKMQIPQADLCFDFIQSPSSKGKKISDVLAVAAARDDIQPMIESIEKAGCTIEEVTVALTEYGKLLSIDKEKHPSASLVIDVGKESSWFTFFEGNTPRYCRKEDRLCEHEMLSAVDKTISLDSGPFRLEPDEAKAVIRQHGIERESGHDEVTGKSMPLFQLHSMLRPYTERVALMVRNIISRFIRESGGAEVASIFFTGPGEYLKGLPDFIEKKLGIHTEHLPVFEKVVFEDETAQDRDEEKEALSHVTAVAASTSHEISLLPRNIIIDRWTTVAARVGTMLLAVLLAVLITFHSGILNQTRKFSEILSGSQQVNSPDDIVEERSRALENARNRILWYETAMAEIPNQYRWIGILGEIGEIMPANMNLIELYFDRENKGLTAKLRGRTYPPSDEEKGTVFEFAKLLKSSPFVDTVLQVGQQEKNMKASESGTTLFEIRFRLRDVPREFYEFRSVEAEENKGAES